MENIKEIDILNNDEIDIDLTELIQLMLQKLWIIILCFVVAGTMAFAGTKMFITPKYSSSSMIYILTKTTSVTSLADIQIGEKLTVDFEYLALSRPVIEEVIDNLNMDNTYNEVVNMINISNPEDTRILKITVEHEDPVMAKKIANEMAEVTADRVSYVMDTDKPNVVENAVVAKDPSSPNALKNTVIGALFGAMVAVGVILLCYLMNDTIETEEDVRKYLDLHTLAAIPLAKEKK